MVIISDKNIIDLESKWYFIFLNNNENIVVISIKFIS